MLTSFVKVEQSLIELTRWRFFKENVAGHCGSNTQFFNSSSYHCERKIFKRKKSQRDIKLKNCQND